MCREARLRKPTEENKQGPQVATTGTTGTTGNAKEKEGRVDANAVDSDGLPSKYRSVRQLVELYFLMVRNRVSETVPKAIVHCMVKGLEEYVVEELRSCFGDKSAEEIGTLLKEAEHITNDRALLQWQLRECETTLADMETIEVEMKLEKAILPTTNSLG